MASRGADARGPANNAGRSHVENRVHKALCRGRLDLWCTVWCTATARPFLLEALTVCGQLPSAQPTGPAPLRLL